jgi:hypothetical protein
MREYWRLQKRKQRAEGKTNWARKEELLEGQNQL